MKLRTQFIVTMLLFGIVLAVLAASAIVTTRQVEKVMEQEKKAADIAQGARELGYLFSDYLIYREGQQLRRWQRRFAAFTEEAAGLQVGKPEQQVLVANIQANQNRVKEVFDSVASAPGRNPPGKRDTVLEAASFQVSWSRMAVQSQVLESDASRLLLSLRQDMDELTRKRTMFIYVITGLFGLLLFVSYMQTYRRILNAIEKLRDGAAVIGSGNLDFTIEETKNDEIGELSRAFNRMTADLKSVTASKADLEREISERRQAEEARSVLLKQLQQMNEEAIRQRILLETVISQTPIGLVVLDCEGQTIVRNEKAETMSREPAHDDFFLNYRGTSKYRRDDGTFYQTEDLPAVRALRKGETILAAPLIFDAPDGREVHLSVNATPLLDSEGRIAGSVSVYWDVTEQKRAEAHNLQLLNRVQEEKERLSSLVGSMSDEVWFADCGKQFTLMNPAAAREFGLNSGAGVDVRKLAETLEVYRPDGSPRPVEEAPSLRALGGETVRNQEEIIRTPATGELRYRQVSSNPVKSAGGHIIGSVSIVRDITERKRGEETLQERTRQLETANRELESFAYSISHDLRAPLRAIDGYARIILKYQGDKFDADTSRKFNEIRSNVQRMGQLIDDILNLSRFSRAHLSMVELDMEELVRDVWKEVAENGGDRRPDLRVAEMPPGWGDRTLIRQVLGNLLANAVKFSSVREEACIEAGGYREGSESIYYIRDNGVGFDMQYYDKLFGVFSRLHGPEDFEGTGVGLAIVQRIVHRHGGRVWAEAEVDKGATFYFTLSREAPLR